MRETFCYSIFTFLTNFHSSSLIIQFFYNFLNFYSHLGVTRSYFFITASSCFWRIFSSTVFKKNHYVDRWRPFDQSLYVYIFFIIKFLSGSFLMKAYVKKSFAMLLMKFFVQRYVYMWLLEFSISFFLLDGCENKKGCDVLMRKMFFIPHPHFFLFSSRVMKLILSTLNTTRKIKIPQ